MTIKNYVVLCLSIFTILSTIHIEAQTPQQRKRIALAQKRAAQKIAQQRAAQQKVQQRAPQRTAQPPRLPQRSVQPPRIPQRAPQRATQPPRPPQRPAQPHQIPQRPAQAPRISQQNALAAAERNLIIEQQQIPWTSKAGLMYGLDKMHGSRVNHILHHTKPAPYKPVHAIFLAKTRKELFDLIDEAWLKIPNPYDNPSGQFDIQMNRPIGIRGERRLKLIVIPGTAQIITAYPIR